MIIMGWLARNLRVVIGIYAILLVIFLISIEPKSYDLADRVAEVTKSNCEGLPNVKPDASVEFEPFDCYIKVRVRNLEDAQNISNFEHIKLLTDGEQYGPETTEN